MATRVQSAGWGFRLGRAARRALRGYRRGEQRAVGWLVANGLPGELSWAAVWCVRLSIVAVLLYTAFWVAVLIAIAIGAVFYIEGTFARQDDDWGFPTWEELREMPGYDPVPYEDIVHPDYPHKLTD